MKKVVFTTAWEFIKKGLFTTLSDALKAAWNKIKLTNKLKSGVARFSFLKKDGSIRQAVGTLSDKLFSYTAKGNAAKLDNVNLVKYWDMESGAFRCFNMTNFLGFN